MAIRRALVLTLLLVVTVAACGSDDSSKDSGSATTTGTELKVTGEAADTLSGTLSCSGDESTGTGMFADNAVEVCQRLSAERGAIMEIATAHDRMCAQMYGGPEHARIQGTVDGEKVDVTVTRSDGCGIDDWKRLEWLLGPPAA